MVQNKSGSTNAQDKSAETNCHCLLSTKVYICMYCQPREKALLHNPYLTQSSSNKALLTKVNGIMENKNTSEFFSITSSNKLYGWNLDADFCQKLADGYLKVSGYVYYPY